MPPIATFPCPACGAPVEPAPNKTQMPCPYCNHGLVIPAELRWRETPKPDPQPAKPARFDPFAYAEKAVSPEMRAQRIEAGRKTSDFLRRAEPVASNAYRAYAWWTIFQFFTPGCLTILAILCVLTLVLSAIVVFIVQRAS